MEVPKFLRVFIPEDLLLRYSSGEIITEDSDLFPLADHLAPWFRGWRTLLHPAQKHQRQVPALPDKGQVQLVENGVFHFLPPIKLLGRVGNPANGMLETQQLSK